MAAVEALRTPRALSLFHHLNPVAMVRNLWAHRDVTWQLAQRDIAARYRSTYLGLAWSVLNPLVLLAIYTVVFTAVIPGGKLNLGTEEETTGQFALGLFCGMILYNVFSEVLIRATGMVIGNPAYVKKLVFPLEIFVVSGLIAALINMLLSLAVWLIGWCAIMHTWPPVTLLWLIVVLVPLCLLTAGLAWVVASLGVFIRDLGQAVLLCVQMLFFLTPIFYSVESIARRGEVFRKILYANPLTWVVENGRNAMMVGLHPDWRFVVVGPMIAGFIALLGYAFFMKSKRAFADVV